MAKQKVIVPDIGGAEGAEVIELLVAVGDVVELEQSLIVLESDKASMEIPSTVAGTVVELLVSEGQELSEGSSIAVIESSSEIEESASHAVEEAPAEEKPEATVEKAAVESVSAATESVSAATESVSASAELQERTVQVPDIGSDDPVELIEISVAVGDQVAEGDSLVALESDKASMEVPAPFAGEVLKVLVTEGASIKQGDDLLVLRTAAASAAAPEMAALEMATPEVATTAQPAKAAEAVEPTVSNDSAVDNKSAYAGPAVRKLAREFGLDLGKLSGTGPRGRIMKEDLHAFAQKSLKGNLSVAATGGAGIPPVPEVDFSAFGEIETDSLSKMARLTAANMQRSWLNVPHVTQFDDADISDLEVFRKDLKAEADRRGTKLTPMPFILKACAVALRDNPKFCASLSGDGQSLIYKKYIHIGMAVDTPAGLLVPVIRDVDKKSLWELAEEVIEIAGKARDRKLRPDEMRGGCFTISSLGGIGGRGFTPIVNAPEVGILGVSKADIRPVWNGEKFKPRKMLPLALSYDHRVINGGDAGRFLTQYVALLSDIRRLVL